MLKITMVGTGYVGLVSGVCLSQFGFDVLCVDNNTSKIDMLNRGEVPIYEPGLQKILSENAEAGRLHFSTDLAAAVQASNIVFIAVGTPAAEDGTANLEYVFAAAEQIAKAATHPLLVVLKSTVPVGTCKRVLAAMNAANPNGQFSIASNPEFLREGSAVKDFMFPDRIIVGVDSEDTKARMAELYYPLSSNNVSVLFTDLESSELIKYASNCFLATKIAFVNEMANLCDATGANVQDVARGMGLDKRISPHFLQPGPGYGGSCFPKDTHALGAIAQSFGAPSRVVESTIASNEAHKARMIEKIKSAFNGNLKGKTIGVLGLTFKANTDDMRDSASLVILPALLEAGAAIHAFDPQGMAHAKALLPEDVQYKKNAYDAAKDADALLILTEWNEFKVLDFAELKAVMKTPMLIDLRNLYRTEDMRGKGITYHSLGRKTVSA